MNEMNQKEVSGAEVLADSIGDIKDDYIETVDELRERDFVVQRRPLWKTLAPAMAAAIVLAIGTVLMMSFLAPDDSDVLDPNASDTSADSREETPNAALTAQAKVIFNHVAEVTVNSIALGERPTFTDHLVIFAVNDDGSTLLRGGVTPRLFAERLEFALEPLNTGASGKSWIWLEYYDDEDYGQSIRLAVVWQPADSEGGVPMFSNGRWYGMRSVNLTVDGTPVGLWPQYPFADEGELPTQQPPPLPPEIPDVTWLAAPTTAISGNLSYCWVMCDVFFDVDSERVIDERTAQPTGNVHWGHGGGARPAWVYDAERDLLGWQAYGDIEMHPRNEFAARFPESVGQIMMVHGVDSSLREYVDGYWTGYFFTDEAWTGETAVAFNGEFVTEFEFDTFSHCEINNRPLIRDHNRDGRVVSELISVVRDGRYGVVNHRGEVVVPFEFDGVLLIDDYTAFARVGDLWGIVTWVDIDDVPNRVTTGGEPPYAGDDGLLLPGDDVPCEWCDARASDWQDNNLPYCERCRITCGCGRNLPTCACCECCNNPGCLLL
jgi:hypothetical protein